MVKGFEEMGLPVVNPDGAFYLFVDIRKTKMNSEKFALELIKKQKVAVVLLLGSTHWRLDIFIHCISGSCRTFCRFGLSNE